MKTLENWPTYMLPRLKSNCITGASLPPFLPWLLTIYISTNTSAPHGQASSAVSCNARRGGLKREREKGATLALTFGRSWQWSKQKCNILFSRYLFMSFSSEMFITIYSLHVSIWHNLTQPVKKMPRKKHAPPELQQPRLLHGTWLSLRAYQLCTNSG